MLVDVLRRFFLLFSVLIVFPLLLPYVQLIKRQRYLKLFSSEF